MFKPYRAIIVFQKRFHEPQNFVVMLVEYYAPGCFKAVQKIAETFTYPEACNIAKTTTP